MFRILIIVLLAIGLGSCDMVDTVTDGFRHTKAVESELAASTGLRPGVGFNWVGGKLETVTVQFPSLYEAKPLRELAEVVQASVTKHFKQRPGAIIMAFELKPGAAGRTAQATP